MSSIPDRPASAEGPEPASDLDRDRPATPIPLSHNPAAEHYLQQRRLRALQALPVGLSLAALLALGSVLRISWIQAWITNALQGVPSATVAAAVVGAGAVIALVVVELARSMGWRLNAAWLRWRHGWSTAQVEDLVRYSRLPADWCLPDDAVRREAMHREQCGLLRRDRRSAFAEVLGRWALPFGCLGLLAAIIVPLVLGSPMPGLVALMGSAASLAAVGAILGLQSRRDRRVGLAWLDRELASKPAVEAGA